MTVLLYANAMHFVLTMQEVFSFPYKKGFFSVLERKVVISNECALCLLYNEHP